MIFHLLVLLSATKQSIKNATPKIVRMKNETQGNVCPRADARRHRHACVSGDRERIRLKTSGTWFSEKKVPLRKDMGKITKLINSVIS